MILAIDASLPLPVYEQVREQVARMVAAGTIQAGHRLPTIRQLAADLGLAKGTVARAYELLESDGVIASEGRRGSFVREAPKSDRQTKAEMLADVAQSLVVTARQAGANQDEAVAAVRAAWARL